MPSDPSLYRYNEKGKQVGLNWQVITHNFLANCSPDERTAQIRTMPLVHKPVKRTVSTKRTEQPTRLDDDKIELIKAFYEVGNKVSWIAKEMNLTDRTVRKYLHETGVYEPGRDASRKKES